MRINLRSVRMEDIFPVMNVLDGVAVTTRGAFSVGWELTLPVAYTKDEDEYDEMAEALVQALRVLPPWTVVHRQDLYTYRTYRSGRTEHGSYLEECYDRHFEGRRYLEHRAYLFVTFGDGSLVNKEGKKSALFGLQPKLTPPPRSKYEEYLTKAREFIRVFLTPGHIGARELTAADWLGDGADPGVVQRYMMLGDDGPLLSDIPLSPSTVQVHDKVAQSFVIGEARHMPTAIPSVKRNDAMSTGASCEIFLSLGANLGILLDCEHAVNHYIIVPPQTETLQNLDSKRKSMNAGITSRDNRTNYGEISEYLDDAERENYLTVHTHLDVIAWGSAKEQAAISGKISAALMDMGMMSAVRNLHNTPVLWYAGTPGAEVDLGMENAMTQEVHAALCLGCYETFDSGLGEGDLRLCDRVRNIPVITDVDDVSASRGYNHTNNKFVVGPSGTGKSYIMNRILNCEYNAGADIFILDVGDSYEGQTRVINETTGGTDGHYLSWSSSNLPSFNPFVGFTRWLNEKGNLAVFAGVDGEEETGVDYIISVLQTLYTPAGGWRDANEPILKRIVRDFVAKMIEDGKSESDLPVFDDFYRFIVDDVTPRIVPVKDEKGGVVHLPEDPYLVGRKPVTPDQFDVEEFSRAIEDYSADGVFYFFYNDPAPKDIFSSRWVVAELDRVTHIKDRNFYSLVVLQLMHSFDLKMRRTSGRKVLVVDEAWQAIMNRTMAPYLKGLWKTCRKYSTAAIVVTQEIADITGSDVIKDAILANSDIKILLNQTSNRNVLTDPTPQEESKDIRKLLGLTPRDIALLLSMDRQKNAAYNYREVFIKYSGGFSAVYANEASPEEALAYESNKRKKAPLLELAERKGSMVEAIEETVKRNRQ